MKITVVMAVSTTVMQRRSAVKVETLPVALSVFVVVPLAFVAQQVNSAVQVAKVAVILSSKLLSIPTLLNEIHVHCHEAIETTDTILSAIASRRVRARAILAPSKEWWPTMSCSNSAGHAER